MSGVSRKRTQSDESIVKENDATRLKIFRGFLKLTQKDAAEIIGVSLTSYRSYETGVSAVPSGLRRRLGQLSKIEVKPLDPHEDPRKVFEELKSAKRSDISPRLLIKIHKRKDDLLRLPTEEITAMESQTNQQTVKRTNELHTRRLKVVEHITRERERVDYVRENIFSRKRNRSNSIRDFVLIVALIYIAMKGLSIKLGFPFGTPANQPDFILVASAFAVLSLAWAALQDLMFDPKSRKLPIE